MAALSHGARPPASLSFVFVLHGEPSPEAGLLGGGRFVTRLLAPRLPPQHVQERGVSLPIVLLPEFDCLGAELSLQLLRTRILYLELIGVFHERLLEVAHDLFPNGLLHAEVSLQCLHVPVAVAVCAVIVLPLFGGLLRLVLVVVEGFRVVLLGGEAEYVPQVRDGPFRGHPALIGPSPGPGRLDTLAHLCGT